MSTQPQLAEPHALQPAVPVPHWANSSSPTQTYTFSPAALAAYVLSGKLKPAARCSALLALFVTSAICNRNADFPHPSTGSLQHSEFLESTEQFPAFNHSPDRRTAEKRQNAPKARKAFAFAAFSVVCCWHRMFSFQQHRDMAQHPPLILMEPSLDGITFLEGLPSVRIST